MKKVFLIIILYLVGFSIPVFSQSININNIFSPGVTFGLDYLSPSALYDSTDFQFVKYKTQFVIPIRTRLGVDLKDFNFKKADAKASQIFLTTRFSVAHPSLSENNYFENIYKGEIEVTAITASLRNGIWVYSANLYSEESSASFKEDITPNLRAYTAYVGIKNLKLYYFFGGGLVINHGKFYPLPLFGFRAKLAPKLTAELIVPVHAKLKYALGKKMTIEVATYLSGINAVYREGNNFYGDDNTLNFKQLKTYLALNTKVGKNYKIKLEGGYAYLQKIDVLSTGFSQDMSPASYVSLSLNYNFGNSIFGNFVNGGN